MADTIRVKGLTEAMRALALMEKGTKRAVQAGLREAAGPIAETARQKLARYQGTSLSTIKPSATVRGVAVVQRARKVTGLRPDFGGVQMRRGFEPAADEHMDTTAKEVERRIQALIELANLD